MCSRLIHAGVKHEAVFVCSLQQQKLQERLHLRGASLHQPSSEAAALDSLGKKQEANRS